MKKIFTLLLIFISVGVIKAQQSAGEAINGTSGKLTITFTTVKPATNITTYTLAVWVQNSANTLQNSLLHYTTNKNSTASYMTTWWSLIGGWGSTTSIPTLATKTKTNIDSQTGPTRTSSQFGVNTAFWGKTVNLSSIVDGVYTVGIEILNIANQTASLHQVLKYTFTKGTSNSTGVLSGSAQSSFSNVSVQWVPAVSAINDVKLEKLYSVYPNPTKSDIYVSGTDIESVQILSLDGCSMFFTKDQKLNISQLKAGTYLAYITTAKGSFIKKIIKE